jgi:hypothetical protein
MVDIAKFSLSKITKKKHFLKQVSRQPPAIPTATGAADGRFGYYPRKIYYDS